MDKGKRALQKDKVYEKKQRMDWFNKKNDGVSDFLIHPDLLCLEDICFYCFCLKRVENQALQYLRKSVLQYLRYLKYSTY